MIQPNQENEGDEAADESSPKDVLPVVTSLDRISARHGSNHNDHKHDGIGNADADMTELVWHEFTTAKVSL